jgi:LacI family transcriptional regulator
MSVTLHDIARLAHVSVATVSMALHDNPRIALETRERIRKIAKELQYSPNAHASSLVRLRENKATAYRATIAFYDVHHEPGEWRQIPKLRLSHAGALEQAESLGYKLERFWAFEPDISGDRMSDILQARGIKGILLYGYPGWQAPVKAWPLRWDQFSTVMMVFNVRQTHFHQVSWDPYQSMVIAMTELYCLGHREMGLAVSNRCNEEVDYRYAAAFEALQRQLGLKSSVPHFNENPIYRPARGDADFSNLQLPFLHWFSKHRPTALLLTNDLIYNWLIQAGFSIPGDVSLAYLESDSQQSELGGMSIEAGAIGSRAIELLAGHLVHNKVGIPDSPMIVTVKPRWHLGKTVRAM